jgi:hypothetical protein
VGKANPGFDGMAIPGQIHSQEVGGGWVNDQGGLLLGFDTFCMMRTDPEQKINLEGRL